MSTLPSEWISKSIAINSETHVSNEELVRFLRPLLMECGLSVMEYGVVEGSQRFINLVAFSHNSSPLVAFNTHLDTVSAGNPTSWTKTGGDPFRATISKSRVYGLGAADVKLDFLCKIMAAKLSHPWTYPFCLVGTYGEERGLVGAVRLLGEKKIVPKMAIIGEPSNLELIYAHKGHLVMSVAIPRPKTHAQATKKRWKGKAAHSSTPELGRNALVRGLTECFKRGQGIVWMDAGTNPNRIPDSCIMEVTRETNEATARLFALVSCLSEISRDLLKRRDPRFSPATCTLSLTQARTLDSAFEITFDVRFLPDVAIDALSNRLKTEISRLGLSTTFEDINYPLKGKKEGLLMKHASRLLKSCGVTPVCKTKASATEASVYQRAGAEALVFGPGVSIGNAHRPNEYNLIRHLDIAVRFYTRLMQTPLETPE